MNPLSQHSIKLYLTSPELDDSALPLFVSVTGAMALAIFKRWHRESAHSNKADAPCIKHFDVKQDPSSQDEALTFLAVSTIDKEPKEVDLSVEVLKISIALKKKEKFFLPNNALICLLQLKSSKRQ